MNEYIQLRSMIADAVHAAVAELRQTVSGDSLWAFALCPDEDVRYFYHVACTEAWIREQEVGDPGIGSNFAEWSLTAKEALFDPANALLSSLADRAGSGETEWTDAKEQRFEVLVLALKDCREVGVFEHDTLLCVGCPDPSDHLESLCMGGVERLNSQALADRFTKDLGYEKYRDA